MISNLNTCKPIVITRKNLPDYLINGILHLGSEPMTSKLVGTTVD